MVKGAKNALKLNSDVNKKIYLLATCYLYKYYYGKAEDFFYCQIIN